MLDADYDAHNGGLEEIECPVCGTTGRFKYHGKYRRWVVAFEGGSRLEKSVVIHRVRCRACRTVHSLVPAEFSGRSPYSASFREAVASDYARRSLTVAEICEKYDIGTRTLYRILHDHNQGPDLRT